MNGTDILSRQPERFVIDFYNFQRIEQAALFEAVFEHLENLYVDYFENSKRQLVRRNDWWCHRRSGAAFRNGVSQLKRYVATPRVAKHRVFVWIEGSILCDSATFAIAREDDTTFGILHSRFHERWSLRMCTWLGVGNDPRYTPTTCFETFPFPEGLTPDIPAEEYADDPRAIRIADAAERLNTLRENWLNPADLIVREPEVVEGYPDRILPKDEEAAKILKKRTLTNLYNERPAWLDHAHAELDSAVAAAYGWEEDWAAGMDDEEILKRLFDLNQKRAANQ